MVDNTDEYGYEGGYTYDDQASGLSGNAYGCNCMPVFDYRNSSISGHGEGEANGSGDGCSCSGSGSGSVGCSGDENFCGSWKI